MNVGFGTAAGPLHAAVDGYTLTRAHLGLLLAGDVAALLEAVLADVAGDAVAAGLDRLTAGLQENMEKASAAAVRVGEIVERSQLATEALQVR